MKSAENLQSFGRRAYLISLHTLTQHTQIHNPLTVIIQVNLCQPAMPVKSWRMTTKQSFTAHMLLMMTT